MAKPDLSERNTTNRAYYFARRKDTGMAGVWFTHCATEGQQGHIVDRLHRKCIRLDVTANYDSSHKERSTFPVQFLADNFAVTVREYCKNHNQSISLDLTLLTLREAGHDIKQMP